MVVKVKEYFKTTRHVKNNDKPKKYFLRGERNVRYFARILSKKRNLIIRHNFVICKFNTVFVNFLEDYIRYKIEIFMVN